MHKTIGFYLHYYPPYHWAGSETMAHEMAKQLKNDGYKVVIYTTEEYDAPDEWEIDGVKVVNLSNKTGALAAGYLSKCSLIITHHQNAAKTATIGRICNVPTALIVHNEMQYSRDDCSRYPWDMIIFNTSWVKNTCLPYLNINTKTTVLHPPVNIDSFTGESSKEFITLINLNEHKGANIFYRLAELLPNKKFLGVIGGHGKQIVRTDLKNVSIHEQTSDIKRDVYSRASVVLMPSVYESYGMVAAEASAMGIPVIAEPTAGLYECLGRNGIFLNRDAIKGWENEIRALTSYDKTYYNMRSRNALQRAQEIKMKTLLELTEFSKLVQSTI